MKPEAYKHHVFRSLPWLILGALLMLFSACEFINKKKAEKPDSTRQLLSKDRVYFARTQDLQAGFLTLQPSDEAYCEVEFWPMDADPAAPGIKRTHVCAEGQKKLVFDERLSDLAPSKNYVFRIFAWREGQSRATAEIFEGVESDFSNYVASQAKYGEMMVARLDAGLKSATVHRFEFVSEADSQNVISDLRRDLGCRRQTQPLSSPYFAPSPVVKMKFLLTRGFANATSASNAYDSRSLIMDYEILQPGDSWEFSYTLYTRNFEFIALPPSQFTEVGMNSFSRTKIDPPVLRTLTKSVQVAKTRKISLDWKTINLQRDSYVIAFIQADAPADNVVCYFDPTSGSALIPSEPLAHLPAGKYRMTVYLESKQIQRVPEATNHHWMISSVDWRSIYLEFL